MPEKRRSGRRLQSLLTPLLRAYSTAPSERRHYSRLVPHSHFGVLVQTVRPTIFTAGWSAAAYVAAAPQITQYDGNSLAATLFEGASARDFYIDDSRLYAVII